MYKLHDKSIICKVGYASQKINKIKIACCKIIQANNVLNFVTNNSLHIYIHTFIHKRFYLPDIYLLNDMIPLFPLLKKKNKNEYKKENN